MFRILVVEDDEHTSTQLRNIITEQIDDVEVETALNVPDAHDLITAAREKNQPYDVVVLDLMLPPEDGLKAELDESICKRVRLTMERTLVAHITAHDDDATVERHLEVVHGPSQIDFSFRLSKDTGKERGRGAYSFELIERLRPFLYGRRIKRQLRALFNGGEVAAYAGMAMRPRGFPDDRSKTHELAALTRNISKDWEYLSEGLRTQIRDIFNVSIVQGEVTISLF